MNQTLINEMNLLICEVDRLGYVNDIFNMLPKSLLKRINSLLTIYSYKDFTNTYLDWMLQLTNHKIKSGLSKQKKYETLKQSTEILLIK